MCLDLTPIGVVHLILYFVQIIWGFFLIVIGSYQLSLRPKFGLKFDTTSRICVLLILASIGECLLSGGWIYNQLNLDDYSTKSGGGGKRYCAGADLENWAQILNITFSAMALSLVCLVFLSGILLSNADSQLNTTFQRRFAQLTRIANISQVVILFALIALANVDISYSCAVGLVFVLIVTFAYVFVWREVFRLKALVQANMTPYRVLQRTSNALARLLCCGFVVFVFAILLLIGYMTNCQFPTSAEDLCAWAFHGFNLGILGSLSTIAFYSFTVSIFVKAISSRLYSCGDCFKFASSKGTRTTNTAASEGSLGDLNELRDTNQPEVSLYSRLDLRSLRSNKKQNNKKGNLKAVRLNTVPDDSKDAWTGVDGY